MSGLRFLRSAGMEGSTGNLREFSIDAGYTGDIFTGDLVSLSAGNVIEATAAASSNDFTTLGVFAGCMYTAANGDTEFSPFWDGGAGRTNIRALVIMPESCTFLIRGTTGQAYVQADIGTRKGVIYAAGSTLTGMSGITLGNTGATVATAPLIVHREVDFADGLRWFEVSIVRAQLNFMAA
jgi:hypothetical protein